MRVRMIRPAYWTDADLHTRLTADVREFYIGCWMEADDAGFLPWDIDRIGADLYPYRSLTWRRGHIAKWMDLLAVAGHVQLLDCGKHAVVPNLPKYQACPRPSYQHKTAHGNCIRHVAPHGATGEQRGTSTGSEGKRREGKRFEWGRRGASMRTSDFRAKAGVPAFLGGGKPS